MICIRFISLWVRSYLISVYVFVNGLRAVSWLWFLSLLSAGVANLCRTDKVDSIVRGFSLLEKRTGKRLGTCGLAWSVGSSSIRGRGLSGTTTCSTGGNCTSFSARGLTSVVPPTRTKKRKKKWTPRLIMIVLETGNQGPPRGVNDKEEEEEVNNDQL